MHVFSLPVRKSALLPRSAAIAVLLGAAVLARPPSVARAETMTGAPVLLAQAAVASSPTAAAGTAETKAETVEQRIASLHTALQITPEEETNWNGVALAMRENAQEMEKLVAEKTAKQMNDMTAVEDLQTYGKFARAHVHGLTHLTEAFETLYNSMPAPQKKIADQVFHDSGRDAATAHG